MEHTGSEKLPLSRENFCLIFSTRKSVDKVCQILLVHYVTTNTVTPPVPTNTVMHPMAVSDSSEMNLKNSLPGIFNFHACSSVSLNINYLSFQLK